MNKWQIKLPVLPLMTFSHWILGLLVIESSFIALAYSQCNQYLRYRTADGSCNNVEHPTWGKAHFTCYRRLLPAYYKGESGFRESVRGGPLPPAREIAQNVKRIREGNDDPTTQLSIYFGQFLVHEISGTRGSETVSCCPPSHPNSQCIAEITKKEGNSHTACQSFFRSAVCEIDKNGKRNQEGLVTPFIDGSLLYGNDEATTKRLRANDGTGKMKVQPSTNGPLLPQAHTHDNFCDKSSPFCFTGGDPRINQHIMLTALQTIYLRDHNRIAKKLKQINPHWGGETLFQETRLITGSKLQAIVYKEYLPNLLGDKSMSRSNLYVGRRTTYDPTVDPTMINEFSACIARIGHSRLWDIHSQCEIESYQNSSKKDVGSVYPYHVAYGYLEPVFEAASYEKPKGCDARIAEDPFIFTYNYPGIPDRIQMIGADVNRGRDHGLPPYVEMAKFCFGINVRRFRDLRPLMRRSHIRVLKRLYRDVRDIDLMAGILSEKNAPRVLLTPTAVCVQEIVFRNIKFGDRFYFEHRRSRFSPDQIEELRKATLAKMICDNTDIRYIPEAALLRESESNPLVDCRTLPDIDFSYWKDS